MLIGHVPGYPVATIIATVGIILAALYILLMYQRTMQGPLAPAHAADDATCDGREVLAVAPLIALMHRPGRLPAAAPRPHHPGRRRHHERRRRDRPAGRRHRSPAPEEQVVPTDRPRRTSISPSDRLRPLLPILFVFGAACVGVLVEAFAPALAPPARCRSSSPLVGLVGRARRRRAAWPASPASSPPPARSPSTARRCSCRARSSVLGCAGVLLLSPSAAWTARAALRRLGRGAAGLARGPRAGRATRGCRPRSTRWPCSPSAA